MRRKAGDRCTGILTSPLLYILYTPSVFPFQKNETGNAVQENICLLTTFVYLLQCRQTTYFKHFLDFVQSKKSPRTYLTMSLIGMLMSRPSSVGTSTTHPVSALIVNKICVNNSMLLKNFFTPEMFSNTFRGRHQRAFYEIGQLWMCIIVQGPFLCCLHGEVGIIFWYHGLDTGGEGTN